MMTIKVIKEKFAGLYKGFFVLFAIIVFHYINNALWLHLDKRYLRFDSHHFFLHSFRVYKMLGQMFFPAAGAVDFSGLLTPDWQGIFVGLITAPFYFITGLSQDAGVFVNAAISVTLLVIFTYKTAYKIFGNRPLGVMSAFLVSFYPAVLLHQHVFMCDLMLTAMVVTAFYMLLMSDEFKNMRYVAAFVLVSLIGVLTKYAFIVFMAVPFIISCVRAFQEKRRKELLVTFVLGTLALAFYLYVKGGAILSRISYLFNFFQRRSYIFQLSYYLTRFSDATVYNTIGYVFLILFLFSLFFYLRNSQPKRYKLMLISWILPVLYIVLFLCCDTVHVPRYILPSFPFIAIISSYGLFFIKNKLLRKTAVSVAVVYAVFQALIISYMPLINRNEVLLSKMPPVFYNMLQNSILSMNRYYLPSTGNNIVYPDMEELEYSPLMDALKEIPSSEDFNTYFLFLGNVSEIYEPVSYEFEVKDPSKKILFFPLNYLKENRLENSFVHNLFAQSDYVIAEKESRWLGDMRLFYRAKEQLDYFGDLLEDYKDDFKLYKEVVMSDERVFYIYKRLNNKAVLDVRDYSVLIKNNSSFLNVLDLQRQRGNDFFTAFRFQGEQVDTSQGLWNVNKASDDRVEVNILWNYMPLKVRWVFSDDNGDLLWDIYISSDENVKLSDVESGMQFEAKFLRWKTLWKSGMFSDMAPNPLFDVISIATRFETDNMVYMLSEDNMLDRTYMSYQPQQQKNLFTAKNDSDMFLYKDDGWLKVFSSRLARYDDVKMADKMLYKAKDQCTISGDEIRFCMNETHINLNFGDKIAMQDNNFFTSFAVNGKKFDTSKGNWIIEKGADNLMTVIISWYSVPVKVLWKFTIEDSKLNWDVQLLSNETLNIDEVESGMYFQNDFNIWSTMWDKGEIKDDYPESRFSMVALEDSRDKSTLLLSMNKDNLLDRTHLTLQPDEKKPIFTAGDPEKQFSLKGGSPVSVFAASLDMSKDSTVSEDRLKEAKKNYTISDGKMKCEFTSFGIRVLYDGNLMTNYQGISENFGLADKTYNDKYAVRSLEKKSESRMLLTMKWEDIGIKQIWDVSIKDDELHFDIDETCSSPESLTDDRKVFFVAGIRRDYNKWFTDVGEGSFDKQKDWRDIIMFDLTRNIIGVSGGGGFMGGYPESIGFMIKSDKFLHLNTVSYKNEERLLKYAFLIKKGELIKDMGFILSFKEKTYAQEALSVEQRPVEISRDDIKLVFRNGQADLFYKDVLLTKGFGLYTSINYMHDWHDSSKAFWEIVASDENRLIVKGYWLYLPITQEWFITLREGDAFSWEVRYDISGLEEVYEIQSNLMLDDMFNKWHTPVKKGIFKNKYTDRWVEFVRASVAELSVSTGLRTSLDTRLQVDVGLDKTSNLNLLKALNTDDIFSSRVVQAATLLSNPSGKYSNGDFLLNVDVKELKDQ